MWLRGSTLRAELLLPPGGVLLMSRSQSVLLVLCVTSAVAHAEAPVQARPSPPGQTAPAPKMVRIAVSIDSQEMSLVIPPLRPAFIGNDRWTQQLAIAATDATKDGATLHILLVPQAGDRSAISKEQVVKNAKLVRKLSLTAGLTITPGSELPREGFGATPPGKITIRVVEK